MVRLAVVLLCVYLSPAWAKVVINGSELRYTGQITEAQNQRAFDLYNSATTKPTALYISSGGGQVMDGMSLGEFVQKQHLDVIVDRFCFSSCANYVLISGQQIFVGEKAIIGWHGNAASAYWRDSDIDAMVRHLTGDKREAEWLKLRNYYDNLIERAEAREKDFYAALGVSPDIMTIGLSKALIAVAKQQKARGWTYSVKALAKLGVDIKMMNDTPWEPQSPASFPLLVIGDI